MTNNANLPEGPYFHGTIIRIPLRSVCSPFSLSQEIFQERDIEDLIENAKNMFPNALIFLQSLQSITIDHWSSSGVSYKNILKSRISSSQGIRQTNIDQSRSSDNWKSTIMKYLGERTRFSSYVVDISHQETLDKFLVCSVVFPLPSDKQWAGMKIHPCVSVAIPLNNKKPLSVFEGSIFVTGFDTTMKIGFPMHVNAPLFLHEWSGNVLMDVDDDMDIKLALKSKRDGWFYQWNQECLAAAINLLMPLALEKSTEYFLLHEDPRVIYCYWPFVKRIKMPFRNLIQETLFIGLSSKTIYYKVDRFVSMNDGYFEYPHSRVPSFFREHTELFSIPKAVFNDLSQLITNVACFLPATARRLLKKNPIKMHLLERPFDVVSVFEYCISDFVDEPGSSLSPKAIAICKHELIGLPLLQLSNGKLAEIGSSVIMADSDQQYLLPKLVESGGFVSSFAVKRWNHIFSKKGFLESCRIERFDHNILLRHIHSILPKSFENKDIISWDIHDDGEVSPENHPSRLWIYLFWKNVPIWDSTIVQSFRRWPLIPTVHHELISCSYYQYMVSARHHSMDMDLRHAILLNWNTVLQNTKNVDHLQSATSNADSDEFWTLGDIKTDVEGMISVNEAVDSAQNESVFTACVDVHDSGDKSGSFYLDITTYEVLYRLHCPIISSAYFSDNDLSKLDPLDQLNSTRLIMASLSFWMDKIGTSAALHLTWMGLSTPDRFHLLQSLVYNSQMMRLSFAATDYSMLRRLPLFETNDGSFSDLRLEGPTYILDSMFDFSSYQDIFPSSNLTLLIDKQQFRDLYDDFQINILTEPLLIKKVLSQEFSKLSVERRDAFVKV